jgi:hypothetical protein
MRTAILIIVVVAVDVRPAQASWMAFYEYLEALSGPGPFRGRIPGFDFPLFCSDEKFSLRCLERVRRLPDDDKSPKLPETGRRLRKFEVAPHFAWLTADGPGDLEYPGTAPDNIRLYIFGGTVTWWVPGHRPGEARAGAGTPVAQRFEVGLVARASALHFTGTGVTADDAMVRVGPVVTYPVWGSFRAFVSPQVQVGLGPFNREEFGALPGPPLNEPVRVHVQAGITF